MPPKRKATISNTLKFTTWDTYGGKDLRKMKCVVGCNRDIVIEDFEAGHVIAETLGGETTLFNLRPVCGKCNKSMGSINMEKFAWDNFRVKLIQPPGLTLTEMVDTKAPVYFADWAKLRSPTSKDLYDFIKETVVFIGNNRFVKCQTSLGGIYYECLAKKDIKEIAITMGDGEVTPLKKWISKVKAVSTVYTKAEFIPYNYLTTPPMLDASTFNLFRGFKHDGSKRGGTEAILRSIFETVCGSDAKSHNLVLDWLSHLVQYPMERSTAIPVIRGKDALAFFQFVGKYVLGDQYFAETKTVPAVAKLLAIVDVAEDDKLLTELLAINNSTSVAIGSKKLTSIQHPCRYVIRNLGPKKKNNSFFEVGDATSASHSAFTESAGACFYSYLLTRRVNKIEDMDELLDEITPIKFPDLDRLVRTFLTSTLGKCSEKFEYHTKKLYDIYYSDTNNTPVVYIDFKKTLKGILGQGKRVTIDGKRAMGYSMTIAEMAKSLRAHWD